MFNPYNNHPREKLKFRKIIYVQGHSVDKEVPVEF